MKKSLFIIFFFFFVSNLFAIDFEMNYTDDANSTEYYTVVAGTYSFRVEKIPGDYHVCLYVNQTEIECTVDPGSLKSPDFSYTINSTSSVSILVWDENWQNMKTYSWNLTVNAAPYKATGASPSNGATGVSITADLNWSNASDPNGDNVQYKVYFGTDSSPDDGEYQTTTTSSYLSLSDLDYEKTYYWRIDTYDGYLTTTGDVWSFTTEKAYPDLEFTNYEVADGSRSFYRGDDLTWTCTVKNTGTAKADYVPLEVYLSTSSSLGNAFELLEESHVGDNYIRLDPEDSDTDGSSSADLGKLSLPSNLSEETYYYIIFVVDPDETGGESTYSNNEEYIRIYIKEDPKPDLDITNFEVADGTREFYRGDDLTWTCTVENEGDAQADYVPLKVYLSTSSSVSNAFELLEESNVGDNYIKLDPGDIDTDGSSSIDLGKLSLPSDLSEDTYYYIICIVDPDETGGESSYSDNDEYIRIYIKPDPKPDFEFTEFNVHEPLEIIPGESIDLDIKFQNTGTKATTSTDYWQIKYYLSSDTKFDDGVDIQVASEDFGIPSVMSIDEVWDDTKSITINKSDIPSPQNPCYLIAQIDQPNRINELFEDNNTAYKLITIQNPANLASDKSSLDFESWKSGSSTELSVVLTNNGDRPASAEVSLAGSDKEKFAILSGGGALNVAAGSSQSITVQYNPSSFGDDEARIEVDGSNCPDLEISLTGHCNNPPVVTKIEPGSDYISINQGDSRRFIANGIDNDKNLYRAKWYYDNGLIKDEILEWGTLEAHDDKDSELTDYTFDTEGNHTIVCEFWDEEGLKGEVLWNVVVVEIANVTFQVFENTSDLKAGALVEIVDQDNAENQWSELTNDYGYYMFRLPVSSTYEYHVFNADVEAEEWELWAKNTFTITDGVSSLQAHRVLPHTTWYAASNGNTTFYPGDDELPVNANLNLDLNIKNYYNASLDSRLQVWLDTDKSGDADLESDLIEFSTESFSNTTISVPFTVNQDWLGKDLYVKVKVETFIDGEWVITDYLDWEEDSPFSVSSQIDDISPEVVEVFPEGDVNISYLNDNGINIIFSEPIDISTLNSNSVKIKLNEEEVSWSVNSIEASTTDFKIELLQTEFLHDDLLSITINSNVTDLAGNHLAPNFETTLRLIGESYSSVHFLSAWTALANADDRGTIPEKYKRGEKVYFYAGADVSLGRGLGLKLYIDLADYYSSEANADTIISTEGAAGYVTCYLTGSVSKGIGADLMGVTSAKFEDPYYDPDLPLEVGELQANAPFVQASLMSYDNDKGEVTIADIQTQPSLALEATLASAATNIVRFEVNRELLDFHFDNILMTMPGIGIPAFIVKSLTDFTSLSDSWKVFPNIGNDAIRPFTYSDDITRLKLDGQITHVRGGRDIDNDGIKDNVFPVYEMVWWINVGGSPTEVSFENLGNDIDDFIIDVEGVPDGWFYQAMPDDDRFEPQAEWGIYDYRFHIDKVEVYNNDEKNEAHAYFLFNPEPDAPDEATVTFNLRHNGITNKLLHSVTYSLYKDENINEYIDNQFEFILPEENVSIKKGENLQVELKLETGAELPFVRIFIDKDLNEDEPWATTNVESCTLIYDGEFESESQLFEIEIPYEIESGTYSIWATTSYGLDLGRSYSYEKSSFTLTIDGSDQPFTPSPITPILNEEVATLTPYFSWTTYSSPLGDNQSGYELRVRCDDDDDRIVYETGFISGTNTSHSYTIGSYTGIDPVTGLERISDELKPGKKYHWHVRVMDESGRWSAWSSDDPESHQVFYTKQLDNEAPTISNQSFSIDENTSAATLIGNINANDPEGGELTYSFYDGQTSPFVLGASSGSLWVGDEGDFNFEENQQYKFRVKVTDDGNPEASSIAEVTVNVNDVNDLPRVRNVEISPSNPTSDQNLILSYDYSDEDGDGDNSIIEWYQNGDHKADFDGMSSVASENTASGDEWFVKIIPYDGVENGTTKISNTVEIGSVNHAPIDLTLSSSVLFENNSANDVIGILMVVDSDDGDTHHFEFVDGYTDNSAFTIDSEGNLKADIVFDFEYKTEYFIAIKATDNAGASITQSFIINILDENDIPGVSNVSINPSSPEISEPLTLSYTFSDEDNDEDNSSIRWYRNNSYLSQYNNLSTILAEETSANEIWYAIVEPNDGETQGTSVKSNEVTIVPECDLQLSSDLSGNVSYLGANVLYNVTILGEWSYEFKQGETLITSGNGTGNGSFTLPVPKNSSKDEITFKLSVSGCDGYVKHEYINQELNPYVIDADFDALPTIVVVNNPVLFNDLSTGNPTNWSWNFGDGVSSIVQNPNHSYVSIGDYTISLTASNSEGEDTEVKTAYIKVVDQPLAIDVEAQNKTSNCENGETEYQSWLENHGGATAVDLGCGNVSWYYTVDDYTPGRCNTGSYIVTFTASGDCGVSVSSTATFTIEDITPPVFTIIPKDTVVECDGVGNVSQLQAWLKNVAAMDDCCDTRIVITNDYTSLSDQCAETGSVMVTWTAIDSTGNSATTSATFTVTDTKGPLFTTIPKDTVVECDGSDYSSVINEWLAKVNATDSCGGAVDISNDFNSLSDLCGSTGMAEVTWTAEDECGNKTTASASFTVEDTVPPTYTIPDDIVIYMDENASFDADTSITGDVKDETDLCSTLLEATFTDDTNQTDCGWIIKRTWSLEDNCGNSAIDQVQNIEVVDNIAPEVLCNSINVVLGSSGTYTLSRNNLNALANGSRDNYTSINDLIVSASPNRFDCDDAGKSIPVTVTVTDACGNSATCQTTVKVLDNSAPVVNTIDDVTMNLEPGICETKINYPQITASDNCSVTKKLITGLGSNGIFPIGTTTEKWSVTDNSGNATTVSFKVTIETTNDLPTLDSIDDVDLVWGTDSVNVLLHGISSGNDCEKQSLTISATASNPELVKTDSLYHEDDSENGSLDLSIVEGGYGESEITVVVTDGEGAKTSQTFSISIPAPVPSVNQPSEDYEITDTASFVIPLSSKVGEYFDDESCDSLSITLTTIDSSPLPDWIQYENDSIWMQPIAADSGCVDILVTATNDFNMSVSDTFEVCVKSIVVSISEIDEGIFEVSMYPNPSDGEVNIKFGQLSTGEIEIFVSNINGARIFQQTYLPADQLSIDLSDEVSGMYFVRIISDGREVVKKLVLKKN